MILFKPVISLEVPKQEFHIYCLEHTPKKLLSPRSYKFISYSLQRLVEQRCTGNFFVSLITLNIPCLFYSLLSKGLTCTTAVYQIFLQVFYIFQNMSSSLTGSYLWDCCATHLRLRMGGWVLSNWFCFPLLQAWPQLGTIFFAVVVEGITGIGTIFILISQTLVSQTNNCNFELQTSARASPSFCLQGKFCLGQICHTAAMVPTVSFYLGTLGHSLSYKLSRMISKVTLAMLASSLLWLQLKQLHQLFWHSCGTFSHPYAFNLLIFLDLKCSSYPGCQSLSFHRNIQSN